MSAARAVSDRRKVTTNATASPTETTTEPHQIVLANSGGSPCVFSSYTTTSMEACAASNRATGRSMTNPIAGMIQVVLRDLWDNRSGRPKTEPTVGQDEQPADAGPVAPAQLPT